MIRTAFLFPGQGSQKVGMGQALAAEFPVAAETFAEADRALGEPLMRLCFEGPAEALELTANTQPAILTVSVAAWRALDASTDLRPEIVAGHSLGEYSALVCAGVLDFVDAVRLVRSWGRFMQEAVPAGVGAMAAVIGLEVEVVRELCREAAGEASVCSPANFNGGGQVVIAGHAPAVEKAADLASERGAKLVKLLPVSAPFHCRLMAPAAERLAAELDRVAWHEPTLPVISNVEARPCRTAADARRLLLEQVTSPVRWEESMRALAEMGVERAIEIGPGRVLTGLLRRIAPQIKTASIEQPDQIRALSGGASA